MAGNRCSRVHSEHQKVREMVRAEMRMPMFKRSMKLRRGVERLFAGAKSKRRLGRLHPRAPRGAQEEFLLGAAVANPVLLVRPADRPTRGHRERPPPLRPGHVPHVGRGGRSMPAITGRSTERDLKVCDRSRMAIDDGPRPTR
jgi:hypothetical protein